MTRLWCAALTCVIGLGLITQAQVAQASIEDTLYEKGILTKEEWVKAKADQERQEAIIQSERSTTEKWYDKLSIRGYTQFRYNYSSNDNQMVDEYDNSIGNNKGFLVRRARIIISGDIHERVSLYFQTDFGQGTGATGTALNNQNFGQIRDLYADVFLTKDKEWRIRAGISKVPFGFDVLQSSQQRLALDRSDAINSAASMTVTPRQRIASFKTGAWIKCKKRLIGLRCSGMILPRMKYPINTGTNVIVNIAAAAIA